MNIYLLSRYYYIIFFFILMFATETILSAFYGYSVYWCLLTLIADFAQGVQMICENGYKPGSHYYHLGDGRYAYHVSDDTWGSIYFKCVFYERGCRGRAVLRHHNGRFRETQPHNHPPDPNFVEDRHFRENLVQNIRAAGRVVNHQEILDQFRSDRRYDQFQYSVLYSFNSSC